MSRVVVTLEVSLHGVGFLGRAMYNGNLMIDTESSLPALQKSVKKLVARFHKVNEDDISFIIRYDIPTLFKLFPVLTICAVASEAEMNQSLLRQYATYKKTPSEIQVGKIEHAIKQIGKRLSMIELYFDNPSVL